MRAVLLAAGLSPAYGEAPPAAPPPATQPAEIARFIEQMADPRYRVRQEAYEQLRLMGPAILEMLYPYRNHADPEIRTRVRELLSSYSWLSTGAMVVKVQPNSRAEQLGFQPGDVIVRMNDTDITGQNEIPLLRATTNRTLVVWRAGRLREVPVPPGIIGFYSTNWDMTKGGENQSAGFAALAAGRIEEAYARLNQAFLDGMEDTWGVVALAGAAEHALDHPRAMEVYDRLLRNAWYFHAQSEMNLLERQFGLPLSGLYTAVLLDRLKNRPAGVAPPDVEQVRAHLVGPGRNWRLAKEIKPATARPDYAAIYLALREGRLRQAINDYAVSGKETAATALAVQAAVRELDVKSACDAAWELVSAYVERTAPAQEAAVSLWAVAAAAADGNDAQVSRLVPNSTGLDRFMQLLQTASPQWRAHTAVASRLGPFMMTKVVDMNMLSESAKRAYVRETLELMAISKGGAAEDWDRAAPAMNLAALRWPELEALRGRFLLRYGRYDEARKALALAGTPDQPAGQPAEDDRPERPRNPAAARNELEAMKRAVEFLSAGAARLDKDWAELKGTLYLYPGRAEKTHWAVRWDGQAILVDTAGKLRQYPGLAAGQSHQANAGDRIVAAGESTLCLRRGQIYLLDEDKGRWIVTHAAAGDWPSAEPAENAPGLDLALRHVVAAHPAGGPGRELWAYCAGPGGWQLFQFGGDIALAVRPADRKVLDLSREISGLARQDTPVAVYRITMVAGKPRAAFIPTDHGLWTLDADGKLQAVPLADAPAKVMVRILPRPERADKLYVGLPPQQGGKVYELDLATMRAGATKGFCSFGPDEYNPLDFAAVPMGYAIQAIFERGQAGRQ